MQSGQPKHRIGMTFAACLWLGLFPLLQCGTYAHITHDKWIIMQILTGITILCFAADLVCAYIRRAKETGSPLSAFFSPLSRLRTSLPLILASALLLWTVLSCCLSGYTPDIWWLGESARYEGLASQLCYFCLFVLFFFSRVNRKPVLLSAATGLLAFLVIVRLQHEGGNPLGLYPAGRSYELNPEFQGTIGNIDMCTGYLLLLAGLFLCYILNTVVCRIKQTSFECHSERSEAKSKNLPVPAVIVSLSIALIFTVYLILVMDVQFGVISLAVLVLYTLLRLLPKKRRLPVLVLLVLIVLLAVWFWPWTGGGIWELHEIFHGRGRLSFGSNRVAVWLFSLRMVREKPVLGGGSGTFSSRFNSFLSDHGLVIPKEQDGTALPDYFDNAHNEYIQQLTDHGIPGLLLFAALLLLSLFRRREGWFPLLSPCTGAVLCYTVQAFFSFSVCIVAPMFWVLLGLSFREPE